MDRVLIAAAMAATLTTTLTATPAIAGDAAAGGHVFAGQCAMCHAVSAKAGAGIGPSLAGVAGRKAGTQAAFASRYSPAMKQYGKVWDAAALTAYVANPAKTVPGNKMPYAGLHDATQVANLVTYLQSLR